MKVFRSALSACVIKDLPNIKRFLRSYRFHREDRKTFNKNNQPGDYSNAAIFAIQSQMLNGYQINRHRSDVIYEENEEPDNGNPHE
jgi:hypothetical protein